MTGAGLASLDGATVLVTGASSGIGAALAPVLAARGATVGVAARRADRLDEVVEQCRHASPGDDPGHRRWAADLSDPRAAAALTVEAWDEMGGLDVVVNNAAVPMRRSVQRLDLATVETVTAMNYLSPVAIALAVLPHMVERDSGVIVNVSSMAGRLGVGREAAYCGSKFALCGWTEAMAMDLWHTGVAVRLVLPGAIATEIWDQPGNDPSPYQGPFEPPEDVAAGICDAICGDRFETWVPDLKAIAEYKTSEIDEFMAGAVEFIEGGRSS